VPYLGIKGVEYWPEFFDMAGASEDNRVASLSRRLCLGPKREQDVRRAVRELGVPSERPVATLWWPGAVIQ